MARSFVSLLAAGCIFTGIQAAEIPKVLPDQLATGWITALRTNDLKSAYALLTPLDQERAEREWKRAAGMADPLVDLQINTVLNFARQENGAQQLRAMALPILEQINPQMISSQVTEFAGFLGMAANAQKNNDSPTIDYAGLHTWLSDLAAFIPKAGFTDQAKLTIACQHLATALKATNLRDAAEARGLTVPQLIERFSSALPELKKALAVYEIQIDPLLESFGFTLIDATPTSGTVIISFTTLDKPRSFALKFVTKNGSWSLADGSDNPIAAMSQLVMMSLLMHGMGTETPAQPPPAPIDDGAL
jgi:hypothetical protein